MFHTQVPEQTPILPVGNFGAVTKKRKNTNDLSVQPKKKRSTILDYKDSGVKKTFLIGIAHAIPETYDNVQVFMDSFDVAKLGFFLGDIKIDRSCYGMQCSSSKFACYLCHATKPYDRKDYQLRTFKSLRENHELFKKMVEELGYAKAYALAKNCKSVVRGSLINGEDWETILDRSPPDELHVGMGVGNKTFDCLHAARCYDFEENGIFHESVYEVWAKNETIVGQSYRGGALDGGNLNKLLRKLDSLEKFVGPKFKDFVDCLRKYDLVKKACFGMVLCQAWRQKIDDFEAAYRSLKVKGKPISVIPKVNMPTVIMFCGAELIGFIILFKSLILSIIRVI